MTATGDARTISGSSQQLSATPVSLSGWALRETAAATASWRLRDGLNVSGPIVACGNLAISGSSHVSCLGIHTRVGLYLEIVSGAIEGAIILD